MQIIDLIFELYKHNSLSKVVIHGEIIWPMTATHMTSTENSIHTIQEHSNIQEIIQQNISGISRNSQTVQKHDLFVCIEGARFDGHTIVHSVDAVAFLCEKEVEYIGEGVVLMVPNTRRAMGIAAALFYQKPSESMFCIGVTGTNGKTTTVSMIEQFCNLLDIPIGTIGTMGHKINGILTEQQDGHTTPESPFLQKLLFDMKQQHCAIVAMEVSSIGLDMERLAGLKFDVAGFSNFSRDHLGFHGSMENYATAKQKLFVNHVYKKSIEHSDSKTSISIVNCDDEAFSFITKTDIQIESSLTHTILFGTSAPNHKQHCQIISMEQRKFGIQLSLWFGGTEHQILLPLIGLHNVYNALLAFLSLKSIEKPLRDGGLLKEHQHIDLQLLSQLGTIRGRLEKPLENKLIFVDYAHTPDALNHALQTLQLLRQEAGLQSKIMVVFGCGGNRDKGKRSEMGTIACHLADVVIVTSDNPRDEDPKSIMDDIFEGIQIDHPSTVTSHAILDRRSAISFAIESMQPDDIVLIAGKGHETYQEVLGQKYPFDDVLVVQEIFAAKTTNSEESTHAMHQFSIPKNSNPNSSKKSGCSS